MKIDTRHDLFKNPFDEFKEFTLTEIPEELKDCKHDWHPTGGEVWSGIYKALHYVCYTCKKQKYDNSSEIYENRQADGEFRK